MNINLYENYWVRTDPLRKPEAWKKEERVGVIPLLWNLVINAILMHMIKHTGGSAYGR
jgi:hypothetical protein